VSLRPGKEARLKVKAEDRLELQIERVNQNNILITMKIVQKNSVSM
jgi:hypothetical protein